MDTLISWAPPATEEVRLVPRRVVTDLAPPDAEILQARLTVAQRVIARMAADKARMQLQIDALLYRLETAGVL